VLKLESNFSPFIDTGDGFELDTEGISRTTAAPGTVIHQERKEHGKKTFLA